MEGALLVPLVPLLAQERGGQPYATNPLRRSGGERAQSLPIDVDDGVPAYGLCLEGYGVDILMATDGAHNRGGHQRASPCTERQNSRRASSGLAVARRSRPSPPISQRTYPLQTAHSSGSALWIQTTEAFSSVSSFSSRINVVNVVGRNVVTPPLDLAGGLLSIVLSLLFILIHIFFRELPLSPSGFTPLGSLRRVLARLMYLPMPKPLRAYDLRH